jgi:hypothetical protein
VDGLLFDKEIVFGYFFVRLRLHFSVLFVHSN